MLDSVKGESTSVSMSIHVALEILLAVLEDENEFGLGVDDVVKAHNVDVFEFCGQLVRSLRRLPKCDERSCTASGQTDSLLRDSPFIKLISRIAVLGVPSSASR